MLNAFLPPGCIQLIWQFSQLKEQASLNREELVNSDTLLPCWKADITKRIEAINSLIPKVADLDYAVQQSKHNEKRSFSLIWGNDERPWTFSLNHIKQSLLIQGRVEDYNSYMLTRRRLIQGSRNLHLSAALAVQALPQRMVKQIPRDNAIRQFAERVSICEMAIEIDQNQAFLRADFFVCTLFFPQLNKNRYRYAACQQETVQIPKSYLTLCKEGEVLTLRQKGFHPVLAKINQARWAQALNSPGPFQDIIKTLLTPDSEDRKSPPTSC